MKIGWPIWWRCARTKKKAKKAAINEMRNSASVILFYGRASVAFCLSDRLWRPYCRVKLLDLENVNQYETGPTSVHYTATWNKTRNIIDWHTYGAGIYTPHGILPPFSKIKSPFRLRLPGSRNEFSTDRTEIQQLWRLLNINSEPIWIFNQSAIFIASLAVYLTLVTYYYTILSLIGIGKTHNW